MGIFDRKPNTEYYELTFKCRCCNKQSAQTTEMLLTLPYETYLKNIVSKYINTSTLQHCTMCGNINVHDLVTVTQPNQAKESIFDGANKKEKQILKDAGINVEEENLEDDDYFISDKHKRNTKSASDQLFFKK